MAHPLRWVYIVDERSYYERSKKDSKIWIEYRNEMIEEEFIQISLDWDTNGYPVVVLQDLGGYSFYKFVEYQAYFWYNVSKEEIGKMAKGYWLKNDGKLCKNISKSITDMSNLVIFQNNICKGTFFEIFRFLT